MKTFYFFEITIFWDKNWEIWDRFRVKTFLSLLGFWDKNKEIGVSFKVITFFFGLHPKFGMKLFFISVKWWSAGKRWFEPTSIKFEQNCIALHIFSVGTALINEICIFFIAGIWHIWSNFCYFHLYIAKLESIHDHNFVLIFCLLKKLTKKAFHQQDLFRCLSFFYCNSLKIQLIKINVKFTHTIHFICMTETD